MAKKNFASSAAVGTLFALPIMGAVLTPSVYAEGEINVATCAELVSQFTTATNGATIKLADNIICETSSNIFKRIGETITIDMNGKSWGYSGTATGSWDGVKVNAGTLKITGEGTINANGGKVDTAFVILPNGGNATLEIGEDITINADDIDLMINKNETHSATLDVYGTLNSIGSYNIYINGVNHKNNIVNIYSSAVLKALKNETRSDDPEWDITPIYAAGNATWNIYDGATIEGATGISLKSGTWNIYGGTISATGPDTSADVVAYSNGTVLSGAAIQIESNNAYYGNVVLNISGGTIKSKNGYTIFDFLKTAGDLYINDLKITGGRFESARGMKLSTGLLAKEGLSGIFGGTFGASPDSALVKPNCEIIGNGDGTYTVKYKIPEVEDDVNPDGSAAKTSNQSILRSLLASIYESLAENVWKNEPETKLEFNDGTIVEMNDIDALMEILEAGEMPTVEITITPTILPEGNAAARVIAEANILPDSAVDISVNLVYDGQIIAKFVQLGQNIEILVPLPDELPELRDGYERSWGVIHLDNEGHGDNLQAAEVEGGLKISAYQFSPYIPYYVDNLRPVVNPGEIILDDEEEVPGAPDTSTLGPTSQAALVVLGLSSLAAIALTWIAKAKR